MSYPVPEPTDPAPMQHGDVSPAPAHETVYPAGDPVITPQPTQDEKYPIDEQGYTDLTNRKPRPRFRIADEVYEGKVEVAAGVMMKYSARAAKMDLSEDDVEGNTAETVKMFRLLLRKDSADRLIEHLHMVPPGATEEDEMRISDEADGDENAVGMQTFMSLLPWLMEQYGMAPTVPSSSASDGSTPNPDDGSSSTPTGPEPESTSSNSPSTESST